LPLSAYCNMLFIGPNNGPLDLYVQHYFHCNKTRYRSVSDSHCFVLITRQKVAIYDNSTDELPESVLRKFNTGFNETYTNSTVHVSALARELTIPVCYRQTTVRYTKHTKSPYKLQAYSMTHNPKYLQTFLLLPTFALVSWYSYRKREVKAYVVYLWGALNDGVELGS
jgi:hypothetical protein